jgi:hypothetical protein
LLSLNIDTKMELLGLDISENIYAVINLNKYAINRAETHVYYVDGWHKILENFFGNYILFNNDVIYFEIEEV